MLVQVFMLVHTFLDIFISLYFCCKIMSMFRLCSRSVRYSRVLGFQSASTVPFRFTSSARISDGPKNLLVLGFGQKSPNPLSHFVGTRHYTVTRSHFVKKCLSCVTFFTGRFEIVPFTHQRLYVFPSIEKFWRMLVFKTVKLLNKKAMLYPQIHPLCIRVESIAIKILEVLQRETGRRHKLADRQWLLKYDGTLMVVKYIREENVKSTSDHLEEGIDWEFMVVDNPVKCFCHSAEGIFLVCSGWLDVCETDDELAIVIATEVGHVVARHVQRAISFGEPISLYYQLRYEQEADHIGMLLAASAGYDPQVAPMTLKKLQAMSEQHGAYIDDLEKRIEFVSQPEVMQEAVSIYQESVKGQGTD